jgi:uncharacterized protein
MDQPPYRVAIVEYIRAQALPADKFSHQLRLYRLATRLAEGQPFDDEVLFAAAWLHDLGVFIGHRPETLDALAAWDHVAYVIARAPALLREFGFPVAKVPAVLEAIRTHLPHVEPTSWEGTLLRDADLLEQLGAVGVLRAASKVGRDTRFVRFDDALNLLRRNLAEWPRRLRLDSARRLAEPRLAILRAFCDAADAEADGAAW